MQLSELIVGLNIRRVASPNGMAEAPAGPDVRVCDLTEDSRTVVPGSLFIARGGLKADGKKFVADACRAGAVAVLTDDPSLDAPAGFAGPVLFSEDVPLVIAQMAERFFGEPSRGLKLVGVTGTNGKTTLSWLVWQMLNGVGQRCGLIGTVTIDDGREVASAMMTTPPAIEISRTLGSMLEAGCVAASMEISSHALDQRRADALQIEVGVFTNLTGDHLDYHKTMENYAAAKARLFEMLPARGTAVVNTMDPAHARMLRDCKASVLGCRVVMAGQTGASAGGGSSPSALPGGECTVQILDVSMQGMVLKLAGPWGEIQSAVSLVGRYNAMNILQACAAAWAMGLNEGEMLIALPALSAPPGRLERVSTPQDRVHVFVDYAHSDDSLRNVLLEVSAVMPGRAGAGGPSGGVVRSAAGAVESATTPGRLWVVFGCGGDRDRTKRPRMGAASAELADMVVVTSDNPRTERPSDIINEILAGIDEARRSKVQVQVDRERAIRAAIEGASPGDVIIIAGKGHETDQILPDGKGGTIVNHFDDREVARAVLAGLRPTAEPKPGAKAGAKASLKAGTKAAKDSAKWARG